MLRSYLLRISAGITRRHKAVDLRGTVEIKEKDVSIVNGFAFMNSRLSALCSVSLSSMKRKRNRKSHGTTKHRSMLWRAAFPLICFERNAVLF
jgi:hypothetical protein